MTLPAMKAYKCAYFTREDGTKYYDILNEYETNPLEIIKSKIIWRLGTFKGEWVPDIDFGFPLAALQSASTDPDGLAQLISDEILKIENVNGCDIGNKSLDDARRIFTCSFIVDTIYGQVELEQTFP